MAGAPQGNQNAAKGKRWTLALEQAMAKMDESRVDGWTTMQLLAQQLVNEAMSGDIAALKEIGDRFEGKPKQQLEHTGVNDGPIRVTNLTDEELANIAAGSSE
jgi:hypothetical protein